MPVTDERLISAVGNARVVAVGEFMHGAQEPLEFRNHMVRLLAEQGLIDAVALESGLIEGRRLNAYVMGGPGTAADTAKNYINWTFGNYAANAELLEWLRAFNARSPKKVAIHGVDLPGGETYAVGDISIGFADAIAYLRRTAAPGADPLIVELEPYAKSFTQSHWFTLTSPKRQAVIDLSGRVARFIEAQRAAMIAASSPEDYAWAHRSALVLRQALEVFRVWPEDNQKGETGKGMLPVVMARDAAMADNMVWLLERAGPRSRMLLFQANGHVIRALGEPPLPPGFSEPWRPIGWHLHQRLGRDMVVMVTGAALGPEADKPARSEAGTLAAALEEACPEVCFIDLRKAPPGSWADRSMTFGRTLGAPMTAPPRAAMDTITFYPRTSAARTLIE